MSTAAVARPDARAWFVLGMLCFVYVLNFLDRQLLSILAKPIQDELQVTDGQLGRISGLYFALFYCLISIPVGWLADRTNRVRVLSFACALVECGDGCLRILFDVSATRRRAHGGGSRRGRRCAAVVCNHFGLLCSGHARHGVGPVQSRPAAGASAGVAFGASIAAAYSWRSAFVVLGAVGVVTAVAV